MHDLATAVAEIRAFNRFYTRFVGALDEGHLGSDHSLVEIRVLYEIAGGERPTSSAIAERLGMDAGYFSRVLKRLEHAGLVDRQRSDHDKRSAVLALTDSGREAFQNLDRQAADEVARAVSGLTETDVGRVTASMSVIRRLLTKEANSSAGIVTLREPRSGDLGWAIERHGILYSDEYGWGMLFEGLVAELFGKFAREHDPARERCWIAELDGRRAGCVFLVEREPGVAQLRCLVVEPSARGQGVGSRLVEACLSFAREAGYERMMLWTNDVLLSARRIYEAAGFRLVQEEKHRDFGPECTGQVWEAQL